MSQALAVRSNKSLFLTKTSFSYIGDFICLMLLDTEQHDIIN